MMINFLCTWMGLFCAFFYVQGTVSVAPVLYLLPLALALAYFFRVRETVKNNRLWVVSLLFGVLFTASQMLGLRLRQVGTVLAKEQMALFLLLFFSGIIGLTPLIARLFRLLATCIKKPKEATLPTQKQAKKALIASMGILLLCWLPVFLAYYPGLFTYDVTWQYLQVTTGDYTTHHPLIHTLMIWFFMKIGRMVGNLNMGVVCYCVSQMLMLSFVMANAISYLYRRGTSKGYCIALLLTFALLPFHSLLAISTTKDTLFTAFILYGCTLLLQGYDDPQCMKNKGWVLRFVVTLALICMLRNNGFVFVVGILMAGFVFAIKQPTTRSIVLCCLCAILVYTLANGMLQTTLGAKKGSINETLSVPIQQLSRVYVLTDDEAKARIQTIVPDAKDYAWSIADAVKNTARIESSELMEFAKLWMEVGLRHPICYLDAFLLMQGDFYSIAPVYPPEETFLNHGQYLDTQFHHERKAGIVSQSLFPWLQTQMTRLYSQNEFLTIPVYRLFLSAGLWCWLMMGAWLMGIGTGHRGVTVAGFACFLLYLSILLGPCVMMRYIYPMMTCAPVLALALLGKRS